MRLSFSKPMIAASIFLTFTNNANAIVYTGTVQTTMYAIEGGCGSASEGIPCSVQPENPSLGPTDQRYPEFAAGMLTGTITTDGTLGSVSTWGSNTGITSVYFTSVNPVYDRTDFSIPPPSPNVYLRPSAWEWYCNIDQVRPSNQVLGCFGGNYFGIDGSVSGTATVDLLTFFMDMRNSTASRGATSSNWYGGGGRSFNNTGILTFTAVPTPATIALLGIGLVGLGATLRKQFIA